MTIPDIVTWKEKDKAAKLATPALGRGVGKPEMWFDTHPNAWCPSQGALGNDALGRVPRKPAKWESHGDRHRFGRFRAVASDQAVRSAWNGAQLA